MSKRIEIKNRIVFIYADQDTIPFLRQERFPDGTLFDSDEEALAWANAFNASSENVRLKVPENKEELVNPVIYTKEELLSFGIPEENIPID